MQQESNVFDQPMIFLRVGWMDRYQGVSAIDEIKGGGAFVQQHGFGYEELKFQTFNGRYYGWAMPGRKGKSTDLTTDISEVEFANIDLGKIGGKRKDVSIPGVTAVWVATSPAGGAYVVGWYENATVYRQPQAPPEGSERFHEDPTVGSIPIGYIVTSDVRDGVLLPKDERVLPIPQRGRGCFGQSNIWYANDRTNPEHARIRHAVLDAIQSHAAGGLPSRKSNAAARQADTLVRLRVEQSAIDTVTAYYCGLGYHVHSVEKDNAGWDLEATLNNRKLLIEVKGLSGNELKVELTPNEYHQMRSLPDQYRLCVVTGALLAPDLSVFSFNAERGRWESPEGLPLQIEEIVSARCTAP